MTTQCPICGQAYGITHACSGSPAETTAWRPPAVGFSPTYYFMQAVAIARLDETAIAQAAKDRKALPYGIGVIGLVMLVPMLLAFARADIRTSTLPASTHLMPVLWLGTTLFVAALLAVKVAICHVLARWWFDARGTFLGIVRPLFLSQVVLFLLRVPYVGTYVSSLWSVAVLMIVFEEVDRIRRMQAFGLSFGVSLIFQAGLYLLHS